MLCSSGSGCCCRSTVRHREAENAAASARGDGQVEQSSEPEVAVAAITVAIPTRTFNRQTEGDQSVPFQAMVEVLTSSSSIDHSILFTVISIV